MVIKEILEEKYDDLQKKHFKRHPNEEGPSINTQYFSGRNVSTKRAPNTVNRKKTLVK